MRERRVYFDASVYLTVFFGQTDVDICAAAIADAEQGNTIGVVSGLVMAEVVGHPDLRSPQGPPSEANQQRLLDVVDYFRGLAFEYVEESRRAGERAMELAVEHGLKGADALHLALAEGAGCDEFYSLDKKHLRVADSLPKMRVRKPYGSPQASLPEDE